MGEGGGGEVRRLNEAPLWLLDPPMIAAHDRNQSRPNADWITMDQVEADDAP